LLHYEELLLLIHEKKPKLLFLTETRVTSDINDCEIQIDGYTCIRCNSSSRYTGGVIIYIMKRISFKIISCIGQTDHNYLLCINIIRGFKTGYYSVVYHSPSSSHRDFLDYMNMWCENNLNVSKLNIIIGDFNIDISKKETYSERLLQMIDLFGLKQYVNSYTRVEKDHKSIIDLVISNEPNLNVVVNNYNNISDHNTIYIDVKNKRNNEFVTKSVISWNNYTKEKLNDKLNMYNWNEIRDCDLETKANIFCDSLKDSVDSLVEKRDIRVILGKEWFSADVNEMKFLKIRAYDRAVMTSDDEDWKAYNDIRNNYVKMLKKSSASEAENELLEAGTDSKGTWRVLKKLVKSENDSINAVQFGNDIVTDNQEIARQFNDFFIDSVVEINESIDIVDDYDFETDNYCVNDFHFRRITMNELWTTILKIETKTGVDNINMNVLKDAFTTVGETLVGIINQSFDEGVFPSAFKTSTVIPIQKVPKTIKSEEFRPINMLPVYEKAMEIVVKDQLSAFIDENNILIEQQSGFRKSHSCETSLNLVLTQWKEEIDKGKVVIGVFLDLKRAFETIDRNLLLRKFERDGVRNNENQWVKSYLECRMQRTCFNGKHSQLRSINLGVPQGSVLGPLMFIIYMNDIGSAIKECEYYLFADDTLLSVSGNSVQECMEKLNRDLENLSKWLKFNKLKLNVSKTKYIIMTGRRSNIENGSTSLIIDGEQIARVTTMKYLGVEIDEKLDFKQHVDTTIKKMAKKVGFLGRIQQKLTKTAKITIYNSIISPHLDYCSSILFLANEEYLNRMQIIQNRAMRIILRCHRRTHVKTMLDNLEWQSTKQRIYMNTLVFIFKIKHNMAPDYLSSKLLYTREATTHVLRNADDFRLPRYNRTYTQNSLWHAGLNEFNKLPLNVKNSDNLNYFKEQVKEHLKLKYPI
jgi:hypothetical protein